MATADRPFWRQTKPSASTKASELVPVKVASTPSKVAGEMRLSSSGGNRYLSEAEHEQLQRMILSRLSRCQKTAFPFSKKLDLSALHLSDRDVPVAALMESALSEQLHTLSLRKNRHLLSVPPQLVKCFPSLVHLDMSSCGLRKLPVEWNLPKLRTLDLSLNCISKFPDEASILVVERNVPDLY